MEFLIDYTSDYTDRKTNNIETAKKIVENLGITNFRLSGYSDTNGVSVYFIKNDKKIRVSDHTVTNSSRVFEELNLSFDAISTKDEVISKTKINKTMVKFFNF
jgi:hypothetical protein